MALNEQDIALIEAYVAGRLSDEEAGAVVERMRVDAEFREEVEVVFGAEVVRGVGRRVALRGALERVEGEVARERAVGRRWVFGVAAAVLVLVVVGWGVFESMKPSLGEELFAEHFEVDLVNTQRRLPEKQRVLQDGIDAYVSEDWEGALAGFEGVEEGDTLYLRVQYWRGICYLGKGEADAAIEVFDEFIEDGIDPYVESAMWYKGLGLLLKGDYVHAKKVLEELKGLGYEQELVEEVLGRLSGV